MKLFLSLLILLASCSPAWHLQKAKEHIEKAKIKGAKVQSDTTYKNMSFRIDGAKTTFNLDPTILHRKDGVENRVILKDTVIYKDRIKTVIKNNTVEIECPDEEKDIKVPVSVDTTIKAGYTKWQYGTAIVGGIVFGLVVGFLLGKIIRI